MYGNLILGDVNKPRDLVNGGTANKGLAVS